MSIGDFSGNWTYGFCESCKKNSGDDVKMVRERIDENSPVMFVCPQCGFTKKL